MGMFNCQAYALFTYQLAFVLVLYDVQADFIVKVSLLLADVAVFFAFHIVRGLIFGV